MIGLEIKGRLGNQFFRYAFARKIQLESGNQDRMILGFSNMKGKNANDGWCDSLKDFNVQPYDSTDKRLVYKYGSVFQKIFDTLFFIDLRIFAKNDRFLRMKHAKKWLHFLNKLGLIHHVEEYHDYFLPNKKRIIIDGGFQHPSYFNSIRETLLQEFTPKHPPIEENAELYNIIKATNSVCISIRRGDFLKSEFAKSYNICSKEYFLKAVETIKDKVSNPVFIVFSDEVEWAKKNLDFGATTYYERGCDPLWEKVRLMSSCRHFIISNSSFSWMVQYLGNAPDKIVVSPNKWYSEDCYPSYLVQENFVKIEV